MYQTVIAFKDGLTGDDLKELREICDRAFNNRAGRAVGRNDAAGRLIYEGGEELYGCLSLGNLALYEIEMFKDAITNWDWIDEDPDESHDVLEALSIPIYY
jgi:hypothetical protein